MADADLGGEMTRAPVAAARSLRVLIAQLNLVVGDIAGNTARMIDVLDTARASGADVALFPELAVCGYPPEDLLLRTSFLEANEAAVRELARHTGGLTAVVGFADRNGDLYNAAAILHDGSVVDVVHKAFLPNYSVFDEERYFRAGHRFPVFERSGVRLGVSICEDVWYPSGPAHLQATAGAEVLLILSASPYFQGKGRDRERMLVTRAADDRAFVLFCNLVGGQDELVFDGNSLVISPSGEVLNRGPSFAEDVFVVEVHAEEAFRERLLDPRNRQSRPGRSALESVPTVTLAPLAAAPGALPERAVPQPLEGLGEVHAALVLGTRDYVRKNGFRDAVVGLSGGIDSSLTASIAVDALGADHVVGVAMPTRFSSPESLTDARALADSLGIRLLTIPIDDIFQLFLDALVPVFEDRPADVTEDNLQPRIRGIVLMALSNKLGYLVLTTGNKSETSVGFATLYGDTAGGFAPLKDVPKSLVYELALWRNQVAGEERIPEHSITRAPSAELRADQVDQDVLPPYDVLDAILEAYVEEEKSTEEIVAQGFDRETVGRIADMVDGAEYKRRQSPPGVKITERAFGRDRRMPITKKSQRPGRG